jgi:adenosylcobinamide-GDP ribazoletransferase
VREFLNAISLLTSFPVRADWSNEPSPGRTMAAYPWVGMVIGGILATLTAVTVWLGWASTVPWVAATLVVAVWVSLTGALHLDGWTDCCDALFVPRSREQRLTILKDTHVGSFGVVGLFLLMVLKLVAVQALLVRVPGPTSSALLPLVAAPLLARGWVVLAAHLFPLARPDGMAAYFRQGLRWTHVALAGLPMLIVTLALGIAEWPIIVLSGIATGLMALLAWRRLGGLTGDVYGAIIEVAEVAVLLGALSVTVSGGTPIG